MTLLLAIARQLLDKDDLSDVIEEAVSIKCMYFQLGRALRLRIDDLRAIRQAYTNEVDTESALNDVLLLWLDQKYNVQRFGPPTWRMLVEAVDKETGGNNHNLAKKIASNHPADTTHKGIAIILCIIVLYLHACR